MFSSKNKNSLLPEISNVVKFESKGNISLGINFKLLFLKFIVVIFASELNWVLSIWDIVGSIFTNFVTSSPLTVSVFVIILELYELSLKKSRSKSVIKAFVVFVWKFSNISDSDWYVSLFCI